MEAALKRVITTWLIGALIVLMGVGVAYPARAEQGAGLSMGTTSVDPNNYRTRSIFIHTTAPGSSTKDQLLLVNQSDIPQTAILTSVDGTVTNTGSYACMQNADPVTGSGAWLKFSDAKVAVPPRSETRVDFTVAVPKGTQPGEYSSCIALSGEASDAATEGEGVILHMRQAVRVVVMVPGETRRELAIASFTQSEPDASMYIMTVENTGNVSADVDIKVQTKNIFGRPVASAGGEYVVMPGADFVRHVEVDHQPLLGGWYKQVPSIRYDQRHGTFGTASKGATYEQKNGTPLTVFYWPTPLGWITLVMSTLLLVMSCMWMAYRRLQKQSVPYTVTQDDTLKSLAKATHSRWYTIAWINHLHPPYQLQVGQQILLPQKNSTSTIDIR